MRRELPSIRPIEPSKIFCNAIVEERPGETPLGISAAVGAGIWLVDRDMRIVWMNEAMEKIYGPLGNIRGGNCFQAFRGRDSKCPDCLPTKAFDSGNIISGYVSRVTQDGVRRFYQLIEAPMFDEKNEVTRVLEIVLDVTEKARLEQSLQESEREYRNLFEHAGTAVVLSDPDGRFVMVNHQFEGLSGYKKEELEGKLYSSQFIHPKDRARLETYTQSRSAGPSEVPPAYEFSFINRWGGERLIHATVTSLPGGRQICAMTDLTEKSLLEREIRSKEQFLTNIMRHSIDAIVALDSQGNIRSWNHGAELVFAYKARDIVGKPFSTLFPKDVRRSKRLKDAWDMFHREGSLRGFSVEAVTKEQKRLLIEITRTAISDGEGSELGSSVILRDITEKKKSELRMIQQEKMLALGELAASLAHEVKNPLNSMVINMEVMRSHLTSLSAERRAELARYVDILESEVQRLNKVMRGVLDFARPIEGEFHKIDVDRVIHHVVDLVRAQAAKEKIKIHLNIAQPLPLMDGTEDHLKQVFLNIFLNAFQAMPNGGKLIVEAAHDPEAGVINIQIKDTGIGIPRQHYKKIFDLYFSTKEKGSGLGLPLVKRLVAAQGGKVYFESRLKHGTTFHISFPASS